MNVKCSYRIHYHGCAVSDPTGQITQDIAPSQQSMLCADEMALPSTAVSFPSFSPIHFQSKPGTYQRR